MKTGQPRLAHGGDFRNAHLDDLGLDDLGAQPAIRPYAPAPRFVYITRERISGKGTSRRRRTTPEPEADTGGNDPHSPDRAPWPSRKTRLVIPSTRLARSPSAPLCAY